MRKDTKGGWEHLLLLLCAGGGGGGGCGGGGATAAGGKEGPKDHEIDAKMVLVKKKEKGALGVHTVTALPFRCIYWWRSVSRGRRPYGVATWRHTTVWRTSAVGLVGWRPDHRRWACHRCEYSVRWDTTVGRLTVHGLVACGFVRHLDG